MKSFVGLIAIEGKETADRRLVEHGALVWALPLPILNGGSMGMIRAIGRFDGFILAGGEIDDMWAGQSIPVGIDVIPFSTVFSADSDLLLITKAELRGFTLLPGGESAWPGARIEVAP